MSDLYSILRVLLFAGGLWIYGSILRRMVRNRYPNLSVKVVTPDG